MKSTPSGSFFSDTSSPFGPLMPFEPSAYCITVMWNVLSVDGFCWNNATKHRYWKASIHDHPSYWRWKVDATHCDCNNACLCWEIFWDVEMGGLPKENTTNLSLYCNSFSKPFWSYKSVCARNRFSCTINRGIVRVTFQHCNYSLWSTNIYNTISIWHETNTLKHQHSKMYSFHLISHFYIVSHLSLVPETTTLCGSTVSTSSQLSANSQSAPVTIPIRKKLAARSKYKLALSLTRIERRDDAHRHPKPTKKVPNQQDFFVARKKLKVSSTKEKKNTSKKK